ncbi:hypothetical protein F4U94_22795 [Sphingobium limneticum]|uniref:hypothetical protein n=1 Tax=Sphingobium limneticum TaxID=1007511 RepID=UPI00123D725D|nr:hypothetical protein [Sphingobium limneticum]KAA9009655.1 hypothetical protein F4U94_22795 [Sphingobium limneticum]
MSLIHTAILNHLPHRAKRGSYAGATRYTFDCPICVQQGHTADKRGRGALFLAPDGSAGYSCFNCQTHSRQAVDKPLATKMRLVLNALGMPPQDITKLNFHLLAAARAKHYPPVVVLPDGLQSIQSWIDQESDNLGLLRIAEFLLDDGKKLSDYYWTPDDNGVSLSRYVVTFEGTMTAPTSWWAFPVLDSNLPIQSDKGVEPDPVEEEPTDAEIEELRAYVFSDEDEE